MVELFRRFEAAVKKGSVRPWREASAALPSRTSTSDGPHDERFAIGEPHAQHQADERQRRAEERGLAYRCRDLRRSSQRRVHARRDGRARTVLGAPVGVGAAV